MMQKSIFIAIIAMLMYSCCDLSGDAKETIKKDIIGFSDAYFNFKLEEAAHFCTESSKKWIRFYASNIHLADLEVIRSQKNSAQIHIDDIIYNAEDSTGIAVVRVENFISLDTLGLPGHIVDQSVFHISFILHNGTCLVRMEAPLRNEK